MGLPPPPLQTRGSEAWLCICWDPKALNCLPPLHWPMSVPESKQATIIRRNKSSTGVLSHLGYTARFQVEFISLIKSTGGERNGKSFDMKLKFSHAFFRRRAFILLASAARVARVFPDRFEVDKSRNNTAYLDLTGNNQVVDIVESLLHTFSNGDQAVVSEYEDLEEPRTGTKDAASQRSPAFSASSS